MPTARLEAFSDGVIAILITVMVLELPAPEGTSWHALSEVWPVLFSYVLSFVYLGIYWNNHHHLFQVTQRVNGAILGANMHLLFWLSLTPFVTAWMGENDFAATPAAVYGINLLICGAAYQILQQTIIREQGESSVVGRAVGADLKGRLSLVLYLAGIGVSFLSAWPAVAAYAVVAAMWLIPDRRIERAVTRAGSDVSPVVEIDRADGD